MDAEAVQAQQQLQEQLSRAREKLDALVHDLRSIDAELNDLAPAREQHRLLLDACGALEQLGQLGGATLFWGDHTTAATGDDHIRRARGRVEAFGKRVSEIEDRRNGVLEEIDRQEGDSWWLEGDLRELEAEQERRDEEWLIEREIGPVSDRALFLPWSRGGAEDQRFRKALAIAVLCSLLLALLVPLVELPLREAEEMAVEVPERVVQLMMESHPLPPPPPVREELEPAKEEVEPKPEPVVAEQAAPEAKPRAPASKGILAFKEKFAGLATDRPVAPLGSQARISGGGELATGAPQRSMLTSQAPGSSGGINLAAFSREVGGGGGGQLEGVQVARATSSIGGVGEKDRPLAGGPAAGRTDEEIQIVFDRYKSALYRLYNRELRSDPTLKGQMVLRLRIEPDGSVSLCELQGTDMKAPQLVAQVLERVRSFDFGPKPVPAITILYPIDFLPTA